MKQDIRFLTPEPRLIKTRKGALYGGLSPPRVRAKVRHLRWARYRGDGAVELVVRKLTASSRSRQVEVF